VARSAGPSSIEPFVRERAGLVRARSAIQQLQHVAVASEVERRVVIGGPAHLHGA
jgi:hypothetical protein